MRIGFFGCSFTEGGGLNEPIFVDYAIRNNLIDISDLDNKIRNENSTLTDREAASIYGIDYSSPYNSISKKYCYPTIVGKKLECEIKNLSKGSSSNEYIFKKLYENYQYFDICIVQMSMYSRRYQWNEIEKKFEHINQIDDYTLHHHNNKYEHDKVSMMIDLFDKMNKKIYWIFQEEIPKNCKSKNIIYFDPDGNLRSFIYENKATISHETNKYFDDGHFSIEGNELISEKIVERINEDMDFIT